MFDDEEAVEWEARETLGGREKRSVYSTFSAKSYSSNQPPAKKKRAVSAAAFLLSDSSSSSSVLRKTGPPTNLTSDSRELAQPSGNRSLKSSTSGLEYVSNWFGKSLRPKSAAPRERKPYLNDPAGRADTDNRKGYFSTSNPARRPDLRPNERSERPQESSAKKRPSETLPKRRIESTREITSVKVGLNRDFNAFSDDENDSGSDGEDDLVWPKIPLTAKMLKNKKYNVNMVLDANGPVVLPSSANRLLRDYQRTGVKWLYSRFKRRIGGVLGDDMGLGKTVQVICFLAAIMGKTHRAIDKKIMKRRRKKGLELMDRAENDRVWDKTAFPPVLIVLPASLVEQWKRELSVWGCFEVEICRGKEGYEKLQQARFGATEIILMSYEALVKHVLFIKEIKWACIIFDEAHRLKSRKTKLGAAVQKLSKIKCKLALTGTPLQNDLMELWCFFDTICPGSLGDESDFKIEYRTPILQGRKRTASRRVLGRASHVREKLEKLISKMILQRFKTIIADQLPIKEEKVIFCRMSDSQLAVYDRVLKSPDFQMIIRKNEPCDCGRPMKRGKCCHQTCPEGLVWPRSHPAGGACKNCPNCVALGCMAWLTKIGCHLELLKPQPDHSEEDQKYYSDFARMAFGEEQLEAVGGLQPQSRLMDLVSTEHCGKMRVLEKLLPIWKKCGNKLLLFSCYTKVLDILGKFMTSKGYQYLRLDGKTPSHMRLSYCDRFNNDSSIFCFFISTNAGGVGLNLTGADRVVIFDPNWNPAHDAQAQDRAYRIGQRKDVKVFRLVSSGSIEEQKYIRQMYKNQVNNETLTGRVERRYFEGVAKDPTQKGELFGFRNLFRLEPDGHLRKIREQMGQLKAAKTKAKQVPQTDEEAAGVQIDDDCVSKNLKALPPDPSLEAINAEQTSPKSKTENTERSNANEEETGKAYMNASQMFDDKIDEAVSSTDLFGANRDEKIRVLQARQAHDHKLDLMKEQAPQKYSSGSALHVLRSELSSPAIVQPAKKQHAIEEINAHADAIASRALRFKKKKKRKKGKPNGSKVANDLATSATKSPIREDKNEATNKRGAVATKTSKELPESIRKSLRLIFSIFGGDDKRVEAAIEKHISLSNVNCER